jgi:hypothetical protein
VNKNEQREQSRRDQQAKLDAKRSRAAKAVRKLMRDGSTAAVMQEMGYAPPERPSYERPRPRVLLLVPSYKNPHPWMQESMGAMIEFSKPWVEVFSPPRVSSGVVHWARNGLLKTVVASGEPFDYVLYCDDDMVVHKDTLVRLLSHRKHIVASLTTRRQDPPIPTMFWLEKNMEFSPIMKWKTSETLLEVDAAGTGLMLISREAINAVGEYWMRCGYERQIFANMFNASGQNAFTETESTPHDKAIAEFAKKWADELENGFLEKERMRREYFRRTGDAWWFQFLPKLSDRGEYGEDVSLCMKARLCGISTYVDLSVRTGHIGEYVYSIQDFLDHQHKFTGEEPKPEQPAEERRIVLAE